MLAIDCLSFLVVSFKKTNDFSLKKKKKIVLSIFSSKEK